MKAVTIETIAEVVKGVNLTGGRGEVTSVVTDSRNVKEGSLFVAIPGARVDGHSFLSDVLKKGAMCAFAEKLPASEVLKEWAAAGKTILRVENTVRALQVLAGWYLAQFDCLKVGITGSVGKTSTKEMTARILSVRYHTIRNEGNLNSGIGLPLTVFKVDDTTEAAVLEMGMNHRGEIHELAEIGRPDIALITTVGSSHLEALGTREAICTEKCSVADFMDEAGTLIINDDNDLLREYDYKGNFHLVRVGTEGETLRLSGVKPFGNGTEFDLTAVSEDGDETEHFVLPLPGLHNAMNAALAVAAGLIAGVSLAEAKDALSGMTELTGDRLSVSEVRGITLLDDCYNASPESDKAAIDTLMLMEGKRKVAILGDMFELGSREKEFHGMVGNYAGRMGVDALFAVGKNAMFLAAEYVQMMPDNPTCKYYETKEELIRELPELLRKGDTVLVKASHSMAFSAICEAIRNLPE